MIPKSARDTPLRIATSRFARARSTASSRHGAQRSSRNSANPFGRALPTTTNKRISQCLSLLRTRIREYEQSVDPSLGDLACKAAVAVYKGSAIGYSTGGRQLVAADVFRGFAEEACDNTVGAALIGSKNIRLRRKGFIKLSVATAASNADEGSTVYASDGNTFTLASTGNSSIGKIDRWISGTTCIVYFEGSVVRSI
jgi:hypothetical protein